MGVESWVTTSRGALSSESGAHACSSSADTPQEAGHGGQPQSHRSQRTPVAGVDLDVKLGEGHGPLPLGDPFPVPTEHIFPHGIQLPPFS